jgi:virginiamycin A acetyltransferase
MELVKGPGSYIIEPYSILSYDSRKADGNLPTIQIGKFCSIATNCSFIVSNHFTNRVSTSASPFTLFEHGMGNLSSYSKGDIHIKNDVWIGANCTILDGITIGNGAVIAAGSVVVKSVAPYAIVGGNPAKLIRYRFSEDIIRQLEELQFWEMDENEIRKFDIWSEDIETFIEEVKDYQEFKRSS